jgi:hypothetical protein
MELVRFLVIAAAGVGLPVDDELPLGLAVVGITLMVGCGA